MTAVTRIPVRSEDVEAFRRDGAVMLEGVLDKTWLQVLAQGIALNLAQPSTRQLDWVRDEATGEHLFFDAVTVHHNPFYERYMLQSPIGPIAAALMGSPTALAFYVSVFIRSQGTQAPTPWHQDQTYWCAEGRQALSIWTSLDAVPRGTELRFVRGSHLWERPVEKPYFEQERLGGSRQGQADDAIPVPDFDGADRDRFDLVGWAMEPGDIAVFHGMTIHGGSGRLPAAMGRRTISAQWLGEDARLVDRPGGHDPHWLPEFAKFGLGPGDYPGCAMCPAIAADSQPGTHGT
ncbi:MAG: phytanoyl-CoA dioxygenase family protein [Gammaproteobacteria bacterium]|nr:phytanoyl-CoA dioxygenase family protein [Gammaproteobacteria bacterium]